ncbi:hypothetical protein K8I61_14450 [bacterium]|nr:hypothetical protein [bacterium]
MDLQRLSPIALVFVLVALIALVGGGCSCADSMKHDGGDGGEFGDLPRLGDDDTADDDASDDDTSDDDTGDDDTGDDDTGDDDTGDDDTGDDDTGDDDTGDDDTGDDDTGDDDSGGPIDLNIPAECNPFATSGECMLPYPSSFYQVEDASTETGWKMAYPANSSVWGAKYPDFDLAPTNSADGASPAGPILLHFARDVRDDFLTRQDELEESLHPQNALAVFNMETGERVMFMSEMDMNRKQLFPNRYALIIRPLESMQTGARHVVVLTDVLRDTDGASFESPLAFAALRDGVETTSSRVEDARDRYEDIFTFLGTHGYARENLLLAFDFMVASDDYLQGSVLSMRDDALDELASAIPSYTITKNLADPNEHLARLVEGTFEVPTFLNADNEIEYDAEHHPIRQANMSFPYTLLISKKAVTEGQPVPLVIFGHGLFGNGRGYLSTGGIANKIQPLVGETGVVMVATDWIGLSSGDLDLIIDEVIPDFNRITLVTDRLQQSLVNNLALTELTIGGFAQDAAIWGEAYPLIDESRVYYYGVSLGGIQGSSFTAISDRIERAVLAVPGCVWFNMIPRSSNWPVIKLYLDLTIPDPLVQQVGISFIQTRFDLSDPNTLSPLLFKNPLPDAPLDRAVLVQESIGDSQVPNMTTEMLARTMGLSHMMPPVYDVPGVPTIVAPTAEPSFVQYYLVDQVLADPPPETNEPPMSDNGAHSDMVFLDHALEQVKHFLEFGEAIDVCDGICDPY